MGTDQSGGELLRRALIDEAKALPVDGSLVARARELRNRWQELPSLNTGPAKALVREFNGAIDEKFEQRKRDQAGKFKLGEQARRVLIDAARSLPLDATLVEQAKRLREKWKAAPNISREVEQHLRREFEEALDGRFRQRTLKNDPAAVSTELRALARSVARKGLAPSSLTTRNRTTIQKSRTGLLTRLLGSVESAPTSTSSETTHVRGWSIWRQHRSVEKEDNKRATLFREDTRRDELWLRDDGEIVLVSIAESIGSTDWRLSETVTVAIATDDDLFLPDQYWRSRSWRNGTSSGTNYTYDPARPRHRPPGTELRRLLGQVPTR